MNLTLTVDEDVVERAREVARVRGTSVNALVREYLEQLAGRARSREELAAYIVELHRASSGSSRGNRATRETAYEGRRFEWPRVRR